MSTITFKHGALIRSGPKLVNGGKWDSMLDDSNRDAHTNAILTIYIDIHFVKISPASGNKGTYGDADSKPRKIQNWKKGEFATFKKRLLSQAEHFWNGTFWLKTPANYSGLDWPEDKPTHRCNLCCRVKLRAVDAASEAHYTIAVVRAEDGEHFRSHSRLYSQRDIEAKQLIPHSTAKFWTHYHEVGHLIGLGHVNHRDVHTAGLNDPAAYGVGGTEVQQTDVMGMGAKKHAWHAGPWQTAAGLLTETKASDWVVHMKHHGHHITPARLVHTPKK